MRHLTAAGLEFIKGWERFRALPYFCQGRVWTIGYGHTGLDVTAKTQDIVEEEGLNLLALDVGSAERAVARNIRVPLTDGQWDALVSFAFNCGGGGTPAFDDPGQMQQGRASGRPTRVPVVRHRRR